jgi:hypothetical protein
MQSQKRDRRLGIFFLFIMLAIPSILAYYVSTPFHQKYFNSFLQERAKRFDAGNYDTEYAPTPPPVSKDNEGIRLGNNTFSLISVNKKMLRLKRLESYYTR